MIMKSCVTVFPFYLQVCRVEDISVEGHVKGSVVHFHRARTIVVQSSGTITASGMGIPFSFFKVFMFFGY